MSEALREFELVALGEDLPDIGLIAGDIGTIVLVHAEGGAYEVEFVAADGTTIAVLTLEANQVDRVAGRQILHVRNLSAA